MADNAQKTALARTLNQAIIQRALGLIQQTGKSLPASVVSRNGGIVTVKFEIANTPNSPYTLPNVTVPMIGSEFVRLPIKAGTLGFVIPADAYLGGMSGLGGGTADLSQPANLSALVWSPIGNKNWTASDDEDAVVIYGPDGAILRNVAKTAVLKVTTLESSWQPAPGQPVILKGNVIVQGNLQLQGAIQNVTGGQYAQDINTAGEVHAKFGTGGQVGLSTHTHTQPNDSHGDTESPVSAPTPGT